MKCLQCRKFVHKPTALSWTRFQTCPTCHDKASIKRQPQKFNDDLIIVKKINPVDMYWHLLTDREVNRR